MVINGHIRAAPDTFKYTKIPGNPGGGSLFAQGGRRSGFTTLNEAALFSS